MNRFFKIFFYFGFFLSIWVNGGLFAQEESLIRARALLDSKIPLNVSLAKLTIDSVVLNPQTKDDCLSWTTRAFIYYDLYKREDKLKLNSKLRDTIISSILISNKLDTGSIYKSNNRKILNNLGSNLNLIYKSFLQDSINYKKSLIAFNKFKDIYLLVNPDSVKNLMDKEIEYLLAVGNVFTDIFIKDIKNIEAQNIAKESLLKVLKIEPNNTSANINSGLMYYNQAVNLSKTLDYDADFSQIDIIQENMIKLAKLSEGYIFKVYTNNNNNKKAIEALYYVYRMLLEIHKSDEFKEKGIKLGLNFTEESPNKSN